jgi:thioredoxin 1
MELVLDSIRQEFPKVVNVVFVDVRKHQNDSLTDYYKVNLIPTQVLLDGRAQEFYRHVGYIPADSLSKIIHEDIESHE